MSVVFHNVFISLPKDSFCPEQNKYSMDNFTYWAPTRYEFGRGVEAKAGSLAAQFLGHKVLLVFGQGSAVKSGLISRVEQALHDAGIEYIELGGISPNPVDGPVYSGIVTCRQENVTGILAVGGGSVIDTAKAIAGGVPYDGDFWDFWAGRATMETALPVGVVLTIPAAGSEGSGNSVITSTKDGVNRKISLRTDYALRPKFALLNPELTMTLPAWQTASGVVDMITHILERYFSPTPDVETTDRVAEGVMMAIMTEAPKVLKDPQDYQARANIMWAGTLAHNGVCGCGRKEDWVSHFMEHEISALYGVTHGAGLAVVVPAFMTFMAHHRPEKVAQFAHRVMGVVPTGNDEQDAIAGINRLRVFYASLGMPVNLTQLGVPDADIPLMVRNLHQNKGEVIGGYYPLTAKDTTIIYNLMK